MTHAPPRRIGVLTGGGDCPGLNAVIRAVTKSAVFDHDIEVLGIADGFLGLIENRIRPLSNDDVSNILTRGGTILGTSNKANPARFATGRKPDGEPVFSDVTDLCMRHIEEHALDAIIAIGGDGTISCAQPFVQRGVNVIGVPKTIDNDIIGTEVSFGFLTAVEVATEALDRIHTTAASHHRVMIVEVMGRNAGWIALHAGTASGSDVILIPEIPYDVHAVCDAIRRRGKLGKRFSIICIAEGARPINGELSVARIDPTSPDPIRLGGIGERLAAAIEQITRLETRCTILGHVLRGGTPCAADRILATEFGHHAVHLLTRGKRNRMIVRQANVTTDIEIATSAHAQRLVPLDHPLIAAARAVGTSFGDERA